MRYTLKKSEILRGEKNFEEVFKRGKRINGQWLYAVVSTKPQPADSETQLLAGFSVRRIMKRAVDRNRVKRLMRESYRLNRHSLLSSMEKLSENVQIVFVYPRTTSPAADSLPTFLQVEQDVKQLLDAVAQRSF